MTKKTKIKQVTTKKKAGKPKHKPKQFLKESSRQTRVSVELTLIKNLEKKVTDELKDMFTRHNVRKPHRREKNSIGSLSSIMVGVNAVTRSIEKSKASLVFINKNTQPAILVDHLYVMAYRKSLAVPIITLCDVQPLLEAFNLTSLNAFAFKKLGEYDETFRASLVNIINMLPTTVFEHCSKPSVLKIISPTDELPTGENERSEQPNEASSSEPPNKKPKLEAVEVFPSLMDDFQEKCELNITLPPDDTPFASLYTFTAEEKKPASIDFLNLTGESFAILPAAHTVKKERYYNLATGTVKHNPDRTMLKKAN